MDATTGLLPLLRHRGPVQEVARLLWPINDARDPVSAISALLQVGHRCTCTCEVCA